jgi:hypothetical protein
MDTVRVRYMVNAIDQAVSIYTKYLGFKGKAGIHSETSQCFREQTWT